MPETRKMSFVKPTVNTPFHIDFAWWKQHDNNWRVYLLSCLCQEHQQVFSDLSQEDKIDSVDPDSAEVKTVDGIQHVLMTHCAKLPGFVTSNTTLVDAVFKLMLANGNLPMTVTDLGNLTGKSPDTILRTLSGYQVYKGIRPYSS